MKGKHTSLDKHLKQNVLWIEKIPHVTKVVLGFSTACRHKYPAGHIKFRTDVSGGIKVNAYSGNGVIDIFVRISPVSERENIKKKIVEHFKL